MDYRCVKCGEPYHTTNDGGLQCNRCGSCIFVKERPSLKKELGTN